MNDYYRTKYPDLEILRNPLIETLECQISRDNLQKLVELVEVQTLIHGPCGWDYKNLKYVPMADLNKGKLTTRANFSCESR